MKPISHLGFIALIGLAPLTACGGSTDDTPAGTGATSGSGATSSGGAGTGGASTGGGAGTVPVAPPGAGTGGIGGTTGGFGGTTGGFGGTTGGFGGTTGGFGGTTGGVGGTGASAGFACDPGPGEPALNRTPGSCGQLDPVLSCDACINAKCCSEWEACSATAPNDPCGAIGAGATGDGEIVEFQTCILDAQTNGQPVDDNAIRACAGTVATPTCGIISDATSAMIACLNSKCFTECIAL